MAILLSTTDFKGGKYDIPDSGGYYTTANVQEAITRYEAEAFYKLLGVTLGKLYIAWIQATYSPANADYIYILNPFAEDNEQLCGHQMLISKGIKEYLKGYVFYEYIKNGLKTSTAGVVMPKAETSTDATGADTMRFAENKFNDVLETVRAIQWYCCKHPDAFPDYKGQYIAVRASQFFIWWDGV